MANIGIKQMVKKDNGGYITAVPFKGYAAITLTSDESENSENGADKVDSGNSKLQYTFLDPCIRVNTNFQASKNYYFKFCVRKTSVERQRIKVILAKTETAEVHVIKSFTVPKAKGMGNNAEWITIKTIFSPPDDSFNEIRIEMNRDSSDIFINEPTADLNQVVLKDLNDENNRLENTQFNTQGVIYLNALKKYLPTAGNNGKVDGSGNSIFSFVSMDGDSEQKCYFLIGLKLIQSTAENGATISENKVVLECYQNMDNEGNLSNKNGDIILPFAYTMSMISAIDDEDTENNIVSVTTDGNEQKDDDTLATHWILPPPKMYSGNWLPVYYYNEDILISSNEELNAEKRNRNIELYEIKNIISEDSNIKADTQIYKIGLQGKPGMMFTLNGAELRIGPTGIYQVEYPDLKINEIGIVPFDTRNIDSNNNFFILDYKFKKQEIVEDDTEPDNGEGNGTAQPQ